MINEKILEYLNVLQWQKAGYTGKGVNVNILEFLFYVPSMGIFIPKNKMPRKKGLQHGRRIEAIIKDIASNCNTKILDY